MTDTDGVVYTGGGVAKFANVGKWTDLEMGFKSATVKTVFTFKYKVFDTSYTVGQDYNEVATEVITQLQDESSKM